MTKMDCGTMTILATIYFLSISTYMLIRYKMILNKIKQKCKD